MFTQTQAQTALMAPGADVTALRELFGEFLTDPANVQHVADLLAGADVRYDMGGNEPDELTGWFAPSTDLTLADGQTVRLPEVLRTGRPALIDTTGGALANTAASWNQRVEHIRAAPSATTTSMLVRPDGYVPWSGHDPALLGAALERWFESPAGI